MEFKSRIETKGFRDQLKALELSLPKKAELVAELIAEEIVNHARSTQGGKHPGNWQDVTSALANSIKGRVERDGLEVKAIIEATMEYAAALDAKTGYSVLGGVEKVARRAIRKYQHLIFE